MCCQPLLAYTKCNDQNNAHGIKQNRPERNRTVHVPDSGLMFLNFQLHWVFHFFNTTKICVYLLCSLSSWKFTVFGSSKNLVKISNRDSNWFLSNRISCKLFPENLSKDSVQWFLDVFHIVFVLRFYICEYFMYYFITKWWNPCGSSGYWYHHQIITVNR